MYTIFIQGYSGNEVFTCMKNMGVIPDDFQARYIIRCSALYCKFCTVR